MRAPWTALSLGGAALILAGCATSMTAEERAARCESATVVLLTYEAARAAGDRMPSDTERAAAAAAQTYLTLRCAPPAGG